MFRPVTFLTILLLSFYSVSAFAVGLGEYKLLSKHNQPLNAQIQLLSPAYYNENELQVRLASAEEFDKRGVERLVIFNDFDFNIVKNRNGQLHIELTTSKSIKEPHLNFLLELSWPKGKIVKEFTFLFEVQALKH